MEVIWGRYTITETKYFVFPPDEGAGDAMINFYWNGVIVVFEPSTKRILLVWKSLILIVTVHLCLIAVRGKSWSKTYMWDELYSQIDHEDSSTAQRVRTGTLNTQHETKSFDPLFQTYLLTMSFTLLTLLLTALLSLFILFCLVIKTYVVELTANAPILPPIPCSFRKRLDIFLHFKTKWIVFFTGYGVELLPRCARC